MAQNAQIINIEDRQIVKADIDNGFDRVAHDLTNALARNEAKLSGCEFQILFAIMSKTYRFHKKTDWIASTQLCEMTGMSKAHVSKTLKSLIDKNVITKEGKSVGINPMVSDWKVNQSVNKPRRGKLTNQTTKVNQSVNSNNEEKLTNQLTEVNQSVNGVNQSVNKSCLIRPPQKKNTITKEINTKEPSAYAFVGETIKITQEDFQKFSEQYQNLDLSKELQQLDLELAGKSNYWMTMHAKLNYRNSNKPKKTKKDMFQFIEDYKC